MTLQVQCPGCGTSAYADCSCPDWAASLPLHADPCLMGDLDALVTCPPGSPCCAQDHHHGQAANSCPGGHGACPHPDTCQLWHSATADFRHPLYEGPPPGPCPGGHCDRDIPECAVCRPLVITALPGGTHVQLAAG